MVEAGEGAAAGDSNGGGAAEQQAPQQTKKRSRWGGKVEAGAHAEGGAGEGAGEGGGEAKRSRKSKWDTSEAVDIQNANDPARLNKDAIAKAQRMAAIQAQIAASMAKLGKAPAVPTIPGASMLAVPGAAMGLPAAAPPPPAAPAGGAFGGVAAVPKQTFMPAPLILDDKGRHVDATGKEVSLKASAVSSLKANLREETSLTMVKPETVNKAMSIVDPRMSMGTGQRAKRATFNFVEDQRYIKKADRFRTKMAVAEFNNQLKKMQDDKGAEAAKDSLAQMNLALLRTKKEAVPAVEWWDAPFVGSEGFVEGGKVESDKVNHYVEHPVPLDPPAEAPPPPPIPMFLTKKERKKLRRRTRMERETQRQEMVARGLLAPPEPKVKISNMMRVLSADATADPTKIEQEVRRQMELRLKNHEERNASRKRTDEEKREKKISKLDKEVAVETTVHLYKVGDLKSKHTKQARYKIDINAKQLRLHGVGLVTDDESLLVCEGGPKALGKFQKLLLKRIKWGEDEDEDEDEMQEDDKGRSDNFCRLVWEGKLTKPNFTDFRFEAATSEGNARELLRRKGVEHYWDLIKSYDPEAKD